MSDCPLGLKVGEGLSGECDRELEPDLSFIWRLRKPLIVQVCSDNSMSVGGLQISQKVCLGQDPLALERHYHQSTCGEDSCDKVVRE